MSIFKIILFAAAGLAALFSILIFSGRIPLGGDGASTPVGRVVMWGTLPQKDMDILLSNYAVEAETYSVFYQYVPEEEFSARLTEALASGIGPDVILTPYQTILEQSARITPFPVASYSQKNYNDTFIDGAQIFWTDSGALAFPVVVEPLVMFFNRTLLSKHGVLAPPTYWDEVTTIAPTLTVSGAQGAFVESAIALGSASNIPQAKDIAMTIVSQLGQFPVFKNTFSDGSVSLQVLADEPLVQGGDISPLSTVMRFFMQFSDPAKSTYTWNQFQQNAQDAFVSEKAALYIGYLGEGKTIRERNQRVNMDMTFLPQTRGVNTFVTGMKMYGVATLASTKNLQGSYATQIGLAQGTWSGALAAITGGIPPHREYLAQQGVPDVVKRSALVARGWYDTRPAQSQDLFAKMVQDIASGREEITDAVDSFVSRLQNIYTKL